MICLTAQERTHGEQSTSQAACASVSVRASRCDIVPSLFRKSYMSRIIPIALAVGLIAAGCPQAALGEASHRSQFETGNDMWQDCPANSKADVGTWGLACVTYVKAVIAADYANQYFEHGTRVICEPDGATNGQLYDVVMKWVSDHPQDRASPLIGITIIALRDAFPCRKP